MAQYDGSIRINTKIDSKEASASLMTLENRIVKTADKIASLRSKMDSLKDAKMPTEEYREISDQIAKAELEFNKLLEKQEQMQREGKDNGVAWNRLNEKMDEVGNTIRYAQGELKDLVDTGKAFTLGSETDEFFKISQQLKYAESDMAVLNQRHDEMIAKQKKASGGYRKLGDTAKKSLEKINKSTKKSGGLLSTMASRFQGLALSLLIFNQISKAFNAMISGIKEGMRNLAQYSNDTNEALSLLMSRSTYLKNALATAFSPIVEVAAPILAQFISLLAEAATRVSELFAALMGKDTFTKAVKVQQDYAESMGKTSDSIKDAAKEAKKALAPFDELRQIQFGSEKQDTGVGKNELNPSQMFETVEVSNSVAEMSEGIKKKIGELKEAFGRLFDPLKTSWDNIGPYLISGVKNAFSSLGETAATMGASFLRAWDSLGYGERITGNVLRGFTNLIDTVAILSDRFREAWENAGVGDRIMQHLLDIIETLSEKLYASTEIIKNWASSIDFSPLLEGFDKLLVAVNPIVSKVGDLLLWFLDNVLLPIGKWGIEQALPAAFDLISAALQVLDSTIEALRPLASWLWEEYLKPFGKWAGEQVIKALETVTEKLEKLSDWIKNNQEKVETVTAAVLAFFAAWKVAKFVLDINNLISSLGGFNGILNLISSTLTSTTAQIGMFSLAVSGMVALISILAQNWSKMSPSERVISSILAAASAVAVLAVALGAVKGAAAAALVAGALAAGIAAATIAISAGKRQASSFGYSAGIGRSAYSASYAPAFASLPYNPPALATGTVIPPNREFLATLGDNKREPEVVSPLSTMKQAVMEAIAESGISRGGQSDRPIYLQLDGKTFARLINPYTEEEKTRVGVRLVTGNA